MCVQTLTASQTEVWKTGTSCSWYNILARMMRHVHTTTRCESSKWARVKMNGSSNATRITYTAVAADTSSCDRHTDRPSTTSSWAALVRVASHNRIRLVVKHRMKENKTVRVIRHFVMYAHKDQPSHQQINSVTCLPT